MGNSIAISIKNRLPKRLKRFLKKIKRILSGSYSKYAPKTSAKIFDDIYKNGLWGTNEHGESISGSGSHDARIIEPYIQVVNSLAEQLNWRTATDLGCGDFNIGSKISDRFDSYCACDISRVVLERNQRNYERDGLEFRKLNLATQDPPPADVAFVRQVLQHLNNLDVKRFVDRINRLRPYRYLLVTEHLPDKESFPFNLDKPTGPGIRVTIGSGLVLDEEPFNLAYKSKEVVLEVREDVYEYKAIIRSTLYSF